MMAHCIDFLQLLASQREEAACEVIVSALASAQKLMPGI